MPAVTPASGADPDHEPRPRDAPEVALVERTRPDEVTFAKQVGVFAGMLMFALGLLVPVVVLLWGALSVGVSAMAGTALLHTRGLEPKTFGTALVVGLVVAGGLLLWASLAAMVSAEPVVAPSGRVRPARTRPVGHPFLGAMAALLAASLLMTLAASTHSPFFPYPFATIVLVATVTFIAVVSLVAAFRVVRRLWIVTFDWACQGHYRAGFVTACLLMLGLAGAWAQRAGWSARPIRWAWAEAELDDVHGPTGVVDAGEKLLCLGAGELEPRLARSASAPACSFLPDGVRMSASGRVRRPAADQAQRDACFKALMPSVYRDTVSKLARTFSRETARDAASEALLNVCRGQTRADDLAAYYYQAARRSAVKLVEKERREAPCDAVDELAGSCASALSPEKLLAIEKLVTCRLAANERVMFELWLAGMTYAEIGEVVGMDAPRAKDGLNNALKRLERQNDRPLTDCIDP